MSRTGHENTAPTAEPKLDVQLVESTLPNRTGHNEKPHTEHDDATIADVEGGGGKPKDTTAKNADIGASWLATYNGPRLDITDEDSERVRARVDKFLLPVYVVQVS